MRTIPQSVDDANPIRHGRFNPIPDTQHSAGDRGGSASAGAGVPELGLVRVLMLSLQRISSEWQAQMTETVKL